MIYTGVSLAVMHPSAGGDGDDGDDGDGTIAITGDASTFSTQRAVDLWTELVPRRP
jgi:hypothetical protein